MKGLIKRTLIIIIIIIIISFFLGGGGKGSKSARGGPYPLADLNRGVEPPLGKRPI